MSSLKTPPANIEAEQSLLSAILMDQDTLGDVMRQLKPEDFYDVRHQKIYETAVSMYQAGRSVDAVTLADNLKDRLPEVGGISYLAGLFNSFVPVDINSYVKIIKDCSDRRYLMKMAYELHASAMKGEGSPQDILMSAFDRIYNLSSGQGCGLRPAGECLASTIDMIEANYKRGGGVTGIPTGFSELDNTINGLNAGDLIVIAARASMGKTAFALNIAANVAQNHTAAIFSLEMPRVQLFHEDAVHEQHDRAP
jgi:replicative DNA helicase